MKKFASFLPLTEDEMEYPDSDFLHPTKRIFRVKSQGVLDHRLMGHVWAELTKGIFGKEYEGKDKDMLITKLKGLYKQENMPTPSIEKKVKPEVSKELEKSVELKRNLKEPKKIEKDLETGVEDSKEDSEKSDSEKSDSEIGEWLKVGNGWIVKFSVNDVEYVVSFSPFDDSEKRWKFTYFKTGKRDSSNIEKFGKESDWEDIWNSLIKILKDFIKIFKPSILKFIGMSSSKRPTYYSILYKMYVDNFLNSFKKLSYKSSFDNKAFNNTPQLIFYKQNKKD